MLFHCIHFCFMSKTKLDVFAITLSIPSILLRPFAFGRICKIFWIERWSTIQVNAQNRYKIYTACFMNVLYEFIDFFCIITFLIDCMLLIRFYHITKAWINMLKNDKAKYGSQERQNSDIALGANEEKQSEPQYIKYNDR